MTEKRVKAWALLSKRGNIVFDAGDQILIYRTKIMASDSADPELKERVVPVEIIIKEPK